MCVWGGGVGGGGGRLDEIDTCITVKKISSL